MATQRRLWGDVFEDPPAATAEDVARLNDRDDGRYELYEGTLVREATFAGHGAVCQRIGDELGLYARTAGNPNAVVQNTLIDLTPAGASARTMLAPDIAILRPTPPLPWDTAAQEPPLLAIEVVSGSQTVAELALKAQAYPSAGVDEVWLVDHRTRGVEVWTAEDRKRRDESQTLTSPLLPGFSPDLRSLFEG